MSPYPRSAATALAAAAFDPGPDGAALLNLLAWCASAAGVAGLITVGTLMTLSIRRGEGADIARQFGTVLAACVLAASAAPLVGALGSLRIV